MSGNGFRPKKGKFDHIQDFYSESELPATRLAGIRTTLPRAFKFNNGEIEEARPAYPSPKAKPYKKKSSKRGQTPKHRQIKRAGTQTQLLRLVKQKRSVLSKHRRNNRILAAIGLCIGLAFGSITFIKYGARIESSVSGSLKYTQDKIRTNFGSQVVSKAKKPKVKPQKSQKRQLKGQKIASKKRIKQRDKRAKSNAIRRTTNKLKKPPRNRSI